MSKAILSVSIRSPIRYFSLFILFLISSVNSFALNPEDKPNFIIYLSDDLGYKDISVNGAKVVKTPAIQKLSDEGITFSNAFVASPSCAPSRAALLTGLMPARNGAETNHAFPSPDVPYLIPTLKANGYKVLAFGKVAHYRGNAKCGFDYHLDQQVNLYENISAYFDTANINKPVCIFVGDRRPHVRWTRHMDYDIDEVDLPPYFIDTKETREHRSRYYTDVTGLDSEMDSVLAFLNKQLGNNIMTLFTSDHGAQWPFGKWNLYDAGIRTPLIVKWPGKIDAGSKTDAYVSWIDILPTILDVSGAKIPKSLDGKSFGKVLKGKSDHFRKEIYTTHSGDGKFNVYPIRSIRTEEYKLIWNLVPNALHTNHSDILRNDGAGAYWDSWDEKAKTDSSAAMIIARYYQRPAWEFYNLEEDPNEQVNLIMDSKYKPVIEKLKGKLENWIDEQGDEKKVFQEIYPVTGPKPDASTFK